MDPALSVQGWLAFERGLTMREAVIGRNKMGMVGRQ
jgi:hypothetical protein